MKYFENIKNLEELRKEYKKLVKKNHPDMGGSEEEMKIINVEYEKALKDLENADTTETGFILHKGVVYVCWRQNFCQRENRL